MATSEDATGANAIGRYAYGRGQQNATVDLEWPFRWIRKFFGHVALHNSEGLALSLCLLSLETAAYYDHLAAILAGW
jgi:hypothetical protein